MRVLQRMLRRSPPPLGDRGDPGRPAAAEAIPLIDAEARRRYIAEYAGTVEGWNGPGAFRFLDHIDDIQKNRLATGGGVAEIGVYHGQYFLYLAMLRSGGERALACDVFERQELNRDGSGGGNSKRAIFEKNLLHYLGSLAGIAIVPKSSDQLTRAEIAAAIGPVRILSIDGGHWRDIVINDLCVAASCLHENGVVVLDDVFDMYWPGVTEGLTCYLWDAYDRSKFRPRLPADRRLVPFAVGCNKTLLCFEDKYPQWIGLFEEFGPGEALQARQPGWQERPVLVYDFETPVEELWASLQQETARREAAEAALHAALAPSADPVPPPDSA